MYYYLFFLQINNELKKPTYINYKNIMLKPITYFNNEEFSIYFNFSVI